MVRRLPRHPKSVLRRAFRSGRWSRSKRLPLWSKKLPRGCPVIAVDAGISVQRRGVSPYRRTAAYFHSRRGGLVTHYCVITPRSFGDETWPRFRATAERLRDSVGGVVSRSGGSASRSKGTRTRQSESETKIMAPLPPPPPLRGCYSGRGG